MEAKTLEEVKKETAPGFHAVSGYKTPSQSRSLPKLLQSTNFNPLIDSDTPTDRPTPFVNDNDSHENDMDYLMP